MYELEWKLLEAVREANPDESIEMAMALVENFMWNESTNDEISDYQTKAMEDDLKAKFNTETNTFEVE